MNSVSSLRQLSALPKSAPLAHSPQVPLEPDAYQQTDQGSHITAGALALGALSALGAFCPSPAVAEVQANPNTVLLNQQNATLDELFSQSSAAAKPWLKIESAQPKWEVRGGQQNDSLPSALQWIPASSKDRIPGTKISDDNGWTAEVRFDVTRTLGDTQWSSVGRYSMLTQKGSWNPVSPDYRGLRTDLVDVLVQKNTKIELANGGYLVHGTGAGVQAIGNLGGLQVQESFHKYGGFGGRTGSALQRNQSFDGFTLTPVLTAGVGMRQPLNNSTRFFADSSLQSALALGQGLSSVQGQLSLHYQPSNRWNANAGLSLAASYSNHPAMKFLPSSGVRPGAFVGATYNITDKIGVHARVQTGGIQREPLYTIGFKVGLPGSESWLSPAFK